MYKYIDIEREKNKKHMMAKSEIKKEEKPIWGTLEDLLLASLVSRYGTENYDKISGELIRRTSDHRHIPASCRRRYHELRRTFSGDIDLVHELKKIRILDLKRDVKQRDHNISMMEKKLKKLEETDLPKGNGNLPEGKKARGSASDENNHESNSSSKTEKREMVIIKPNETDLDGDEIPLVAKQIEIKCQPLIKIIAILRAHKNGSVFERKLRSQQCKRYDKLIIQHMDIETVQAKLEKGEYLHSQRKFFRDLLLICTNATIFFPKNSNEYLAASELQKLVTIRMSKTVPKLEPNKKPTDPIRPKPIRALSPDSTPIVVCRRRSSSKPKSGGDAKTKVDEVKPKMKNPKFDVKVNDRVIVKKPGMIKESSLKGSNKKKLPDKDIENSNSDDSDDDIRIRNIRDVKNGKRVGTRERVKETENSSKIVKKGKPGKSSPPVAALGRGVKRGKESGSVEDAGRTRKRLRR